jgi:hypothetical protein
MLAVVELLAIAELEARAVNDLERISVRGRFILMTEVITTS